jgi:LAS superfamily LD-carboxypeptidase LdcB
MKYQRIVTGAFVLIIAFVGVASWYGYTRLNSLSTHVALLDAEFASTTGLLRGSISDATASLANAINKEKQDVQAQLGGVKEQVGTIGGALTDIQKLNKIDPEFLAKYSKIFFLSDVYAPARLVEIPVAYRYNEKSPLQIIPEVLPYLQKMLDQAKANNVTIYVHSAYRSFNTQGALKGQYSVAYGAGTANQFSADQGYSEHQLGTTVDFITTGTGGELLGFDRTPAYAWIVANAYRYGFVLSYPKDNDYYIFEPWHWRFVGVKLSTYLHNSNTYLYTLDQRAIDAYLISIFD